MKRLAAQGAGKARPSSGVARRRGLPADDLAAAKQRLREKVTEVRILDPDLVRSFIRLRQEQDLDGPDEVWEGVYVVPPLASNPHQGLVGALTGILFHVVNLEGRGQVFPGANVSDRRTDWDHNFRGPDIAVVLADSRAVDCGTHWFGGPDFLVEVQSPGDETDEKIPFYSKIQVRELLIIHRDTRQLRLYRHDGQQLVPVTLVDFEGGKWLRSEVVPLAFRRKALKGGPRTEVCRTDGTPGKWLV